MGYGFVAGWWSMIFCTDRPVSPLGSVHSEMRVRRTVPFARSSLIVSMALSWLASCVRSRSILSIIGYPLPFSGWCGLVCGDNL